MGESGWQVTGGFHELQWREVARDFGWARLEDPMGAPLGLRWILRLG